MSLKKLFICIPTYFGISLKENYPRCYVSPLCYYLKENYYLSFPSFLLQKTWSKYNWYYFQFPYRYWKENISLSMFIKLLGLVWKVYLIWSLEFLVFSYRERIPSVFFSFDVNCTCEESEDVHSQFSCVLFYDPQNSFCFAFFS